MNAKERRERDVDLYRARLRGFSLPTLSRSFELTERQCRRIIAAERERQAGMFDSTAEERLEDMLECLDAAVEDLALEADIATSSSAKVKAISARVWTLREKQRLLDEAGLLPRYAPRPLEKGVNFSLAIADILERNDVPPPQGSEPRYKAKSSAPSERVTTKFVASALCERVAHLVAAPQSQLDRTWA
jgi:hypothetical protein